MSSNFQIHPHPSGTGADVTGIDMRHVPTDDVIDALALATAKHCVLRFREQSLDEAAQVAFVARFGKPQGHPAAYVGGKRPEGAERDDVFYLTHGVDADLDEEGRNKAATELHWHTDLQYMPEPQVYSLLYGVEVPPEGGNTEFCNMTAAYDALDDAMKLRVGGLQATHWYVRKIPPVTHPVVRTHPLTRKKALYVSPGLTRRIEGLSEQEGKELLELLFMHSTQRRFVWAQQWRAGDCVFWDNRCTMHRRLALDPNAKRVMRRSQTVGEPVLV